MKNAVMVHGMPDKEEWDRFNGDLKAFGHWMIWLGEELSHRGIEVVIPSMPLAYDPKYEAWKSVFEQYEITPETILIGHSCGAGFLVRWISETKRQVGQVVLVAPWMDPTKEYTTEMFDDCTIDPDMVSRCAACTVIYSIDDDKGVITTVNKLKACLPQAVFKEYSDKGHFTLEDMKTHAFPELLGVLGLD